MPPPQSVVATKGPEPSTRFPAEKVMGTLTLERRGVANKVPFANSKPGFHGTVNRRFDGDGLKYSLWGLLPAEFVRFEHLSSRKYPADRDRVRVVFQSVV